MDYKKIYSKEELDTLISWFKEHMDELPQSIYVDKATYVKDLRYTVNLYFDIAKDLREIPCYGGQIRHLFLIREAIEREWAKSGKTSDSAEK